MVTTGLILFNMKKTDKIIFIGPMGGGKIPKNGASIKNYYIVNKLKEWADNIVIVDTELWKKKPSVLVRLLFTILCNPKAKYILSLNSKSAYKVLLILKKLPRKRCIYYWTIGGSVADWIMNKKVCPSIYQIVHLFLVEGNSMVETLKKCGFNNVICVPNFKKIDFIPEKKNHSKKIRFLFLSRITPLKGCDYIFNCAQKLNVNFSKDYEIDFYGEIAFDYLDFKKKIEEISNANYKGFIDLRKSDNYNILSEYDAMLFPTFWSGEGFPGIMIDAFIAGLPVIASNWHLNKDIITNNRTGFLVNAKDERDLYRIMEMCIKNPSIVRSMAKECQEEAMKYDIDNVVTYDLFKTIGLFC